MSKESLEADIDLFVEQSIETNEPIPDFWDDLRTTERLAHYLNSTGYERKSMITAVLREYTKPQTLRLMAGEMTAQEMRTVQAALKGIIAKIEWL